MVSPILVLWTVLSVLVAGACTFTFLQPFWILHLDFSHSFGMVTYCFMDSRYENNRDVCTAYGGYYHLGNIPSGAWQAACVLYGTGCVLMCLSAFMALCNTSMVKENTRRVALVSGYMQAIADLLTNGTELYLPQEQQAEPKVHVYFFSRHMPHKEDLASSSVSTWSVASHYLQTLSPEMKEPDRRCL